MILVRTNRFRSCKVQRIAGPGQGNLGQSTETGADPPYFPMTPAPSPSDPVLSLRSVTKRYPRSDGTSVTALRSVRLALAPGSTTAVVGRSGSGKTTLLHVAAGIDLPDSGDVQLLGRNLATMRDRERAVFRRDHLGLVFQFFRLLRHLTVEENVTLPALIAGEAGGYEKRARELLERVGLADRARDRIDGLSGGEQQRVAICRALLRRPSVVLADEPTGNLDDKAAKAVMTLMLDLVRDEKKTLLFVTHSVEAAALADTRLELASGRLKV